jgi:hypothetical protein
MSDYGFGKGSSEVEKKVGLDLTKLPKGLPPLNAEAEQEAIRRGEALGFTDRGQGGPGKRRRGKSAETATVYLKGPVEVIHWFIRYTEEKEHSAYWRSIEDFKKLIESGG